MRRSIVTVLVLALVVPSAWAGSLAGVKMDDEVTVADKTLVLNGMGVRSKLWVKVYVAGLYLEQKTQNPTKASSGDMCQRIVMHFLTDRATKSKMDSAWREGFKNNSPDQYGKLKARVDKFVDFFGDMKEGDRLELTMVPGKGTSATLNGKAAGSIEGDDFSTALLLVWLGQEPPTDDLKEGLLGK